MIGTILVSQSPSALFENTANLIANAAQQSIEARGAFSIALSGGSTPKGLFQLLARPEWRDRIDWQRTHVFWGDDRYVPHDDPRSNFRMARELLLEHVKAQHVYPIPTDIPPDEAAAAYERTLRSALGSEQFPRIDFNLLGIGDNGHTASLFPHRPTLQENSRAVVADFIPEVDMYRVTMTAPMINAGRIIAFLISGESKAEVVRDVITGPRRPEELPSQLINPAAGELVWLMDSAAAAKLPRDLTRESKPA
jgi:6-phosphogluconolactonase